MKFNSTIETEDYAKFMKHIDDGCEWNVLMYDSDTNLIAKLPHVSVVSFIDEDVLSVSIQASPLEFPK